MKTLHISFDAPLTASDWEIVGVLTCQMVVHVKFMAHGKFAGTEKYDRLHQMMGAGCK